MPPPPQATSPLTLTDRDLAVLWHPCSQMRDYLDFPPLHVVAAQGCRIRLADGRELLDAISSWWCKSLGHGHPRLRDAMIAQAQRFEHVILANTTNDNVVNFCERIINAANGLGPVSWSHAAPPGRQPGHFGRVFLADNGSTAVEIALKMAIQAQAQRGQPQRTRLAALQNGYHGETVGALSVGDCGLYSKPYEALMFPVTKLGPLPYRAGPDDPAWMDASDAWPAIEARLAPLAGELAAIIYEPVLQGAGGMLLYSPDLLRRLRAWADAHNVYLIADEIAAGMGRLGAMLASHLAAMCDVRCAMFDVESRHGADSDTSNIEHRTSNIPYPDFAVLSKGLTGGVLPLSAVLTTDAVYRLFDADYFDFRAFLHSNTHTGNALAVAVALAALDAYAEGRVLEHVAAVGPTMKAGLAELARTRPYLHRLRGCGMVAAVDLAEADGSPLPARHRTGYRVYREAARRGALLRPLGDTMYLFPPLNTPPADVQAMITVLADSLDAVMK
jgi:adenosylmethionine---8-amino-7-oxononanoate aminotransferase